MVSRAKIDGMEPSTGTNVSVDRDNRPDRSGRAFDLYFSALVKLFGQDVIEAVIEDGRSRIVVLTRSDMLAGSRRKPTCDICLRDFAAERFDGANRVVLVDGSATIVLRRGDESRVKLDQIDRFMIVPGLWPD